MWRAVSAERGEQRIQRQADIMAAIAAKLERYRNPWQELKLQYGANKGKAYTGKGPSSGCLLLQGCGFLQSGARVLGCCFPTSLLAAAERRQWQSSFSLWADGVLTCSLSMAHR